MELYNNTENKERELLSNISGHTNKAEAGFKYTEQRSTAARVPATEAG